MRIATWVVAGLLSWASLAAAQASQLSQPAFNVLDKTPVNANGLMFARQPVVLSPASRDVATLSSLPAKAASRVIYLNAKGVILTPGNNNSRANISSIAKASTELKGWDVNVQVWNETVLCVEDLFSRFDVKIVTDDPGNVPHIEAVFTSDNYSKLDAFDPNATQIAGISPFTSECSIIENSIVFTFATLLNNQPRAVCEVISQEIAHSFGADHQMLASDPLSYLPFTGERSFKDTLASCGEYTNRACGLKGSVCRDKQNSVALLTERLGLKNGAQPQNSDDNEEIRGGCTAAGGQVASQLGICFAAVVMILRRRRHQIR